MHTNDMKNYSGPTPSAPVETLPRAGSRRGAIAAICAAPRLDFLTVVKNNMKNKRLQLGFRLLAFSPPLHALGRLKTRLVPVLAFALVMFCAGKVMATTKDLASVVAQPQVGTLTYGASGSVTFDINATLSGSGSSPNVTYSVTAGLPTGATASFSP